MKALGVVGAGPTGAKAGLSSLLDEPDPDPLVDVERLLNAGGLSLKQLRRCSVALPIPEPDEIFRSGVQMPEERVDCCPKVFASALERADILFKELESESPRILKLINLRSHYMHNSWLQNVERLKREPHRSNPLHMSPNDVRRHGLADGDSIRVANANGSVETRVCIDETLRAGVVAMTHGWGNADTPGMPLAQRYPGCNANVLLPVGPGSYEQLSNQAFMTGIAVTVRAMPDTAPEHEL